MSASRKPDPAPTADDGTDLGVAREVFRIEADGLALAAGGLDGGFTRALDLIDGINGRVVVSGMGKSGHIAHKIAATLASTGTPAFFVHPAEASHGDLGMITRNDAVLAISNSGETSELSDIIAHTRRYSMPLVAITANAGSALAKAADAVMVLPDAAEACPMGLAPTTSTTMTLAMGDALAIALLRRRGFTPDDFQMLHPGGQLGRKLLKVADIMHGGDAVPTASPDDTMDSVLLKITAKQFGCAGIVDGDGALIGIITDGDLRRHMSPELLGTPARDVMTPNPVTIGPDALAAEALRLMNESDRPFTALFVVEDRRILGILNIHDILRSGIA